MSCNLIVFFGAVITRSVSCLNSLSLTQVITATPRQIESLIRLSEALARMRFSEWVSEDSSYTNLNL